MKLDEFIASVPPEFRLGQHFYNTYYSKLKPEDNTFKNMSLLYNTTDVKTATIIIKAIMSKYQWEELPE